MRFFWTLSAVPRPDASYLGLFAVTLGTYLAFRDLPVTILGAPVSTLQLAMAVFFFVSLSRNLILNRWIWRNRPGRIAGLSIVAAMPFALGWIIGTVSPLTLQMLFTAWMLAYAVFVLATVNWDPDGMRNIPSVWARDPRFAASALTLVALGDAAYAVTLAALAVWATEFAWVLFMTLGAVATKLFVNWIVVLMIIVRLDEED